MYATVGCLFIYFYYFIVNEHSDIISRTGARLNFSVIIIKVQYHRYVEQTVGMQCIHRYLPKIHTHMQGDENIDHTHSIIPTFIHHT